VNQTDIENESITDDRIESEEQSLILGRSYQREGQSEEAIKTKKQFKLRMKQITITSNQTLINSWEKYSLKCLNI
jgi:hypothetical protein